MTDKPLEDEQINENALIEKLQALLVTDKKETPEQAMARYQKALKYLIELDEEHYGYLADRLEFLETFTGYVEQDDDEALTNNEEDEEQIKIINTLKEFVVLDKKETAEQAVERFVKVDRFLLASYDEYYYEGEGYPEFFQTVSAKALQDEEKRLTITLPKAYKEFVLKHGLMRYNEIAREMIFPLKTLSEALKDEWHMDDKSIDEAYEGVTHPDDLIIFSYGDISLQSEYYHCFEADGTVYDFNQHDLGCERRTHTDFDAYLQWATNQFIAEFLEVEFDYEDLENWRAFY